MSEQLLHLHLGLYLHPLEIVDLCGSERNLSGGSWVLEELLSFSLSRVDAPAAEKIAKVSFGGGHAWACTKDGKLFGQVYSSDGRLGKLLGTVEAYLDSSAGIAEVNQQIPRSMLEDAKRLVLQGKEKEEDVLIVWGPCLGEELPGVEVVDFLCGA